MAGHALFKWAVSGVISRPRVVAIAALIALIPVGFAIPTLALGVAVWDTLDRPETVSPEQGSIT